jgi:hypothetical protein
MKKQFLLSAVAAFALALPAAAQNTQSSPGMQQTQPSPSMQAPSMQSPGTRSPSMQMQGPGMQGQGMQDHSMPMQGTQGQSGQTMDPSQLSSDEVRQIQQRLQANGQQIRHVDGIWGPETAGALRSFQQQHSLGSGGGVDQATLSALGVGTTGQRSPGSGTNPYGGSPAGGLPSTQPGTGTLPGSGMPGTGTGLPGSSGQRNTTPQPGMAPGTGMNPGTGTGTGTGTGSPGGTGGVTR